MPLPRRAARNPMRGESSVEQPNDNTPDLDAEVHELVVDMALDILTERAQDGDEEAAAIIDRGVARPKSALREIEGRDISER